MLFTDRKISDIIQGGIGETRRRLFKMQGIFKGMKTTRGSRFKRILTVLLLIVLSAAFFVSGSRKVYAEDTLLSGFTWELLFTEDFHNPGAVVQAVGVTENYIYTIENTGDDAERPDVVSAYYRNTTDPDGNPVEQYALAKQDGEHHWEHGNGMTYNPNTRELIVAPYTHVVPENRGCLLVMDPETLQLTRTIKITDQYDILSVAYDPQNDIYYIQTNADALYTNLVLNANFEVINELGPEDPTPGYNFQAFCQVGDYLLQSPLTLFLGIENYLMAYSISQRQVVDYVVCNMGLEEQGYTKVEPEAIARLDDTGFILVVDATREDKSGTAYFYRLTFPNLPIDTPLFEAEETAPETTEIEEVPAAETEPVQTEEPEEAEEAEEADTEVTISKTQDEFVGTEQTPGKAGGIPMILIILPIAAAAVFVWYLNMVRIQRARKRRDARIRRMRKKLINELRDDFREPTEEEEWLD